MRYIRFYLALFKINYANLLTYRFNFVINVIGNLGWGFLGVINMFILTAKIGSAYGWSKSELILLSSVYPLFIAIFYTLFSNNIGAIPDIVNRGELDSFIIKPIDSQFHLSIVRMDLTQLIRIVVMIFFIFYIVHVFHITITFASLILSSFLMVLGLLLVYSLWFSIITISLWLTTLSNLKDLLYFTNGILRYPTEMFFKRGNYFIIAALSIFTLALSIPLKTLYGRFNVLEAGTLTIFSIGFFLFSRWFWKFALRYYVSASG